MELMKQCQKWFEQNEIQKVIDALEAIPGEERTPELDSELANGVHWHCRIGEQDGALLKKLWNFLNHMRSILRKSLLELSDCIRVLLFE